MSHQKEKDYDHSKLTIFFEKKIAISEWTDLIGRVYSYNNSERRMKILSEIKRRDGSRRVLKQFPPIKEGDQLEKLSSLISDCKGYL